MKILGSIAFFAFVTSPLYAETKEGDCQFAFGQTTFEVHVGNQLKGTANFYLDEFCGEIIINANIAVVNSQAHAMHCQYYVAFFDENDRLLGCAGQGSELAPGKGTHHFGSCLIPIPERIVKDVVKDVVRYKPAFYESVEPIGKPKRKHKTQPSEGIIPSPHGKPLLLGPTDVLPN